VNAPATLAAARAGDQAAFEGLVAPHRAALQAHCYRMLGSVQDAEDALQEALLRAWRGLDGLREAEGLRAWLYRIATNACLRQIERRPRRVVPLDYGTAGDPHAPLAAPLEETAWVEPFPLGELDADAPAARYEQREGVELAFVAALQHLPARQRAVLILRDVLGFSAREVADALDTTPASVDSAMQRARATVERRLPERSQQATLRALGDERLTALVGGFVDAWERADVDALVAMLADEATISMPPIPTWFRGREAVTVFLRRILSPSRVRRLVPVPALGGLTFAQYWPSDVDPDRLVAHAILTVALDPADPTRIGTLVAFLDAGLFPRFGLPESLDQPF